MVKVQNGWESNSLGEIERLTSKHGSPRSPPTASALGSTAQTVRSPRTAMAPSLRRQGSSSLSSQGVSAPTGSSQTDNSAHGATSHREGTANQSQKRALAPPANIVPGARRRPHHANLPPNGYRSVNSARPTGTKQRTASQSAAMEADAVETLLFMASPGNSSHHPSTSRDMAPSAPTSSQTSPL